jgi:hypothetical protein
MIISASHCFRFTIVSSAYQDQIGCFGFSLWWFWQPPKVSSLQSCKDIVASLPFSIAITEAKSIALASASIIT